MTDPQTPPLQEGTSPPPALDAAEDAVGKEKKAFQVHIYRDWCKSCGICAALCPKQVLSRNEEGGPILADPDACIGCGWCELHCPDFAISVLPRAEPTAAEEV